MNLNYSPDELERLGRMADQTHPAVLPLCVETLQMHAENLRGTLDSLDALRQEQRQRLSVALGTTLLANVSLTAQFIFFSEINDWDVNLGLAFGASFVSALSLNALIYSTSQRVQRRVYKRLQETTQQVSALYERAYGRAVAAGVIPAETQSQ